jgi:2-oxoglutarate ferredoxin oxidoreductase subunit alpha
MYEEIGCEDAEVVVIAFGCTARSARRAVKMARQEGVKAGLLRLLTVWPFPEGRIRRLVEKGTVKRFVVPEINLGQLRREVERLTDLPVERLNHAGGQMPVPQAILEHIRK